MITAQLLARNHFEHSPIAVFAGSAEASRAVAGEIAALIRVRAREGRACVLGRAPGSTPDSVYAELVRHHREEGLSFAHVTTFNLDEYYPLSPDQPQSYRRFMRTHLFDHVDIDPARTHVPSGTVAKSEVDTHCAAYEEAIRAAGGIDLQILGIGRNYRAVADAERRADIHAAHLGLIEQDMIELERRRRGGTVRGVVHLQRPAASASAETAVEDIQVRHRRGLERIEDDSIVVRVRFRGVARRRHGRDDDRPDVLHVHAVQVVGGIHLLLADSQPHLDSTAVLFRL